MSTISNFDNEYNMFMDSLRQIQSNVLQLNEADEDENKGDSGGGGDDLDALLKGGGDDSGGGDNSGGGDDGGDSGDDDLDSLLKGDGDNEESGDGGGDDSDGGGLDDLDLSGGEEAEKDSFETDSQGLMDTITKLTKAGHSVKIVISAEGKQRIESIDGHKIRSMKQLNEILSKMPVKGSAKMNNRQDKMLSALMEQVSSLTKEIKTLKKSRNTNSSELFPVQEDRYIKVKESDYNALIEMAEDMNFKIDEQEALIKNYETMQEFNEMDLENDQSINDILNELDESISDLNRNTTNLKLQETSKNYYNRALTKTISVFSENIMPYLNNLNVIKANVLNELDTYDTMNIMKSKLNKFMKINGTGNAFNSINESIGQLNALNAIEKYKNAVKSRIMRYNGNGNIMSILDEAVGDITLDITNTRNISQANTFARKVGNILNEATGDISIANPDYDYATSYPQYEYFSKKISKLLNDAYSKSNNSLITNYSEDDTLVPRSQLKKFDLPIMNPEKWNATVTIKSAIANLSEALTDIDGNLNVDLCKRAYLYHKTNNPQNMKDFAMPIAIFEQKEQKLYAHPVLIKNVANILKNDSCMKTYDIGSRQQLYALRESLTPYLLKIGEEIPWKKDNINGKK